MTEDPETANQAARRGGLPVWAELDGDETVSTRPGVLRKGATLNLLAAGFQMVGSFLGIILLSRLLSEESFGIYGVVFPIVSTLLILSDGGTAYVTLREKKPDHGRTSGLFWIAASISLGLFILSIMLTLGMLSISGNAAHWQAGIVISAIILAHGAGQQHMALATRFFRNDIKAIAIVGGVLAGLILSVLLAWMGTGVYALIAFFGGRVLFTCLIIWFLTGWVPAGFKIDTDVLKNLKGLGLPEVLARALSNGTRELDKLAAGLLLATGSAGFYVLAHMFAVTSMRQAMAPILALMMPHLSEMRTHGAEAYNNRLRQIVLGFLAFLGPGGIWVVVEGSWIIRLVTGKTATELGIVFSLLFAGSLIAITGQMFTMGVQADDRPDIGARQSIWALVFMVLCIIAAVLFAGGPGEITSVHLAWGTMAALTLSTLFRARDVLRHRQISILSFAKDAALVLGIALACGLAAAYVGQAYGANLVAEPLSALGIMARLATGLCVLLLLHGLSLVILSKTTNIVHIPLRRRK